MSDASTAKHRIDIATAAINAVRHDVPELEAFCRRTVDELVTFRATLPPTRHEGQARLEDDDDDEQEVGR